MATYTGTANKDTISGGAGDDILSGGLESDTYYYDLGSGNDAITDTGGTADSLVFSNSKNLDSLLYVYRAGTNDANLVFDLGAAGKVTVQNEYAGKDELRIETLVRKGVAYTIAKGVTGGTGHDVIAGTASADTMAGGDGNDLLFGGGGNDILNGDAGNDTLFGGAGNDTLQGGLGDDVYRFDLGTGNDTVSDTGSGDGTNGTGDTISLYDPNDVYSGLNLSRGGTNAADLIFDFGTAGKLTVLNQYAVGGAARIENLTTPDGKYAIAAGTSGTALNDLIVGTAGADTIKGGAGRDWIVGGAGNDVIFGEADRNELHGDAGNDSLVAGSQGDELYGGAGSDTLVGGTGSDTANYEDLAGGVFANFSGDADVWNNVVVDANKVLESAPAGGGTDTLISIENFTGTAFNDCIVLGRTDGTLNFTLGKGNDTVIGGAPTNIPNVWATMGYWDDPNGVIVNLSNRALTKIQLENGVFNVGRNSARDGWGNTDTFILDDGSFSITGSDHNDYLRGRDNNQAWEFFDGGRGNDTIDGGGNVDTVNYERWGDDAGSVSVVVNLSATAYVTTLNNVKVTFAAGTARDGWGGTDTLFNIENANGGSLGDILVGSNGDNFFDGRDGNDTILGNAGNDYLNGGNGDDSLSGGDGNDSLIGASGNDGLDGGLGNDSLDGGDGNDKLLGGEGLDTLVGGAGADTLTGGNGSDIFVFNTAPNAGTNVDRITDFAVGEKIWLDNAVMTGLGTADNVALNSGAFYSAAGATGATALSHRIIYNTTTGDLYYDQDGSGTAFAAVKLAVIGTGTGAAALSAGVNGNFFVI